MTAKQTALYWREWQSVHKRYPDLDRHDLHIRALGADKSSKLFTNPDLDKVLGVFRALTQPASLDAQLRQAKQDRTRLLWKIEQYQTPLLALYVEPTPYILAVLRDQFPHVRDLLAQAALGQTHPPGVPHLLSTLSAKALENLRSTLAARLNDLRNQRGHTIHQMHQLAALKCPSGCAQCRSIKSVQFAKLTDLPICETVATEEPF